MRHIERGQLSTIALTVILSLGKMELVASGVEVNGLALKSNKVRLMYVVVMGDAGELERIPLSSLNISVTADYVDTFTHNEGNLNVKAKRIGALVTNRPDALQVTSTFVDGIVCEHVELTNCRRIERCYAKQHMARTKLEVRQFEPNPFASPERQPKLKRALEQHTKIMLPSEDCVDLSE